LKIHPLTDEILPFPAVTSFGTPVKVRLYISAEYDLLNAASANINNISDGCPKTATKHLLQRAY
jgi:hypothetical protein